MKKTDVKQGLNNMKQEREKHEKQDKQLSVAITAGTTVLLLFSFMFWVGFSGMVPPPGEPAWKTVGRIDFGVDNLGSKKINNFEDPSPTPADRPKANPKPKVSETNPKPKVSNPPPKQNISNTESENTVQESTEPTPPNPKPETTPAPVKPEETSTQEATDPNKTPDKINPSNNTGGGSDHGDTDKTGNKGNPKSKVLDINGSFEFGDGIGGEGGRGPLALPLKNYNIQKEGRITFDFVIAPSGEVVYVKARTTTQPELAAIGKANIKNWKFEEVDPGKGKLRTSVTITFRLK